MAPHIDSYRFGNIVIEGQTYTKDVIIFPDHVMARWWRKEGHALYPEDIQDVLAAKPDVLIVGQGAYGMMRITTAAQSALKVAGIEVQAHSTEKACAVYNELCRTQSAVAALHITC